MHLIAQQTTATTTQTHTEYEITIVIPAYNEEHGLPNVLTQLTTMQAEHPGFEIIVVDDGSTDGTSRAAEQFSTVRVITHRRNRGYGAALKTGIRNATHDIICITDADGTYPNQRIPELTQRLVETEYDMVVGARTGENVRIPLQRKPAKWALNQLANYVAGENIPDLNSGLRIFKRPAVLRFFGILPDGFSFTTTITLAMLTNTYLVDYVPIDYHARIGKSKIRPIRDTLNFTQLVMRIALYFAPLKIFLPVSALFMLGAIVWAVLSTTIFSELADVSTLVLAVTGIQIGLLGLIAELINRRMPNIYRDE
jgi:glycosyltransferase involved in cell wall biosynthesis